MVAGKLPRLWLGPARGGDALVDRACGSGTSCSSIVALAGVLRARNRTMLAVLVAFTLFHLIAGRCRATRCRCCRR